MLDDDLDEMSRERLIGEVRKLRAGIREHRDKSGHNLCWHHPKLWGLLPERIEPEIAVPPWPQFFRGCVLYREALEREASNAPILDVEYSEAKAKEDAHVRAE